MAWVMTPSRSCALDLMRRERTASRAETLSHDEDMPDGALHTSDLLVEVDRSSTLHEAPKTLEDEQRQLLALASLRGYSHGELAGLTGLPLGTVKSKLRRALAYSRRALSEGTRDGRLFYHAGAIAAAGGDRAQARDRLNRARALQWGGQQALRQPGWFQCAHHRAADPAHRAGRLGADRGGLRHTSRRKLRVLKRSRDEHEGPWVQVGRQGKPLFNEAFVAISDKDLYSRTSPDRDRKLFRKYAETPELAAILVPLLGLPENLLDQRSDPAGIFIPDLIKVDLSTVTARLAGGGPHHAANPDDAGFSRLSVFGGDVVISAVQTGLPGIESGTIPGGWANGRRFGDDVVDIAVTAAISDLRGDPWIVRGPAGDTVEGNDIAYNKAFPYAATPLNGRNHGHH